MILPLFIGIHSYYLLGGELCKKTIVGLMSIITLFSNNICYFVVIYLFDVLNFDLFEGSNIFILKYSCLNLLVSIILVLLIRFIEIRFKITLEVEKND